MALLKNKKLDMNAIFAEDSSPELLTICYQNHNVAKLPRVMHKHDDCMELLFVVQGSGHYLVNGEKYYTTQGDILIYNSGVLHDECHVSSDSANDIRIYGCAISGVKIKELPANHLVSGKQGAMIRTGDYSRDIEMLFALLIRQVKLYGNNHKEVIDHLLRALLISIYELSKSTFRQVANSTNEILGHRIQTYLDENYAQDINLEKVASSLNVNKFYLAHVFKAYSGYSPLQYLIRRRIGEAQTLLLNSKYNVTDIAMQVGYNNISHFQQAFVKMVGMSPYKYRSFILDTAQSDYLLIAK